MTQQDNKLEPLPAEFVLLDLKEVRRRVGLGTSTIYRMMDDGEFPLSLSIAARTVRWLESEVNAWIEARMAQRRVPRRGRPAGQPPQAAA